MQQKTRNRLTSFLFYIPHGLKFWKAFKGTTGRIADLRRDYSRGALDEDSVERDPFVQFDTWLNDAIRADLPDPTAMTLATADADGRPGARTVLLKGFDQRGFVFFTNYESRKGRHLAENPQAALLFAWYALERQVEITGPVERVSDEESDAYFESRPISSQIGAWASRQSTVIEGRGALEREVERLMKQYRGRAVPRPPFWGGFRVVPETIEFWQGRPSRLHDRLRFTRIDEANWRIERLSP
ncbi:MAG: pyridoxamine 5'-phosphate oxidase [Verrucomicrobia bacterium]|nr:MAG: pyridoxamine 5'-phosphate oxidase [Verrucomicrobiota bacterium]